MGESFMRPEAELAQLVRRYLSSSVSFDERASWVQDEEEYWETLPPESGARALAGLVMLMAYEVWEGNRYESTAREVIRQEATSLVGT
jgi:hypothetical protein